MKIKTKPMARIIVEDCGVKVFDIIDDADKALDKAMKLFKKKYFGD